MVLSVTCGVSGCKEETCPCCRKSWGLIRITNSEKAPEPMLAVVELGCAPGLGSEGTYSRYQGDLKQWLIANQDRAAPPVLQSFSVPSEQLILLIHPAFSVYNSVLPDLTRGILAPSHVKAFRIGVWYHCASLVSWGFGLGTNSWHLWAWQQ